MKKVLTLTLGLLLVAGMASAQSTAGGWIGLFADPGGAACNSPATSGAITIYVIHQMVLESKGIDFSVDETNANVTHNYTIDIQAGHLLIGDAHNGVSITYGGCQVAPIPSAWINYNINGATACGYLKVSNYQSAFPASSDCANFIQEAGAGYFWFGDVSCGECVVPVQESSWGKIKALYN